MRKRAILRTLAGSAGLAPGAAAMAQAYPARPVQPMGPYPAGGPSDAIAPTSNAQPGKEHHDLPA